MANGQGTTSGLPTDIAEVTAQSGIANQSANQRPLTGVLGARDVIQQGTTAALQNLGQNLGLAREDILAGQEGQNRQSALAGLLGPEAQKQAFAEYQSSPGQLFLQNETEQAVLRNAGVTGGLGGGGVLQELQRQAIGLAQQDFGNQFTRGQQALQSQQLGAQNLANIATQGGLSGANLISGATQQLGNQAFGAGQQLAQAATGTGANLANLQNQLGQGISGITGQGLTNLANLLSGTGQANAQLQTQLATLLANIGTQGASQSAPLTSLAGQFDAAGIQGQNAAVQNAIQQLVQLANQQNTGTGAASGTTLSGTQGQQVA